MIPAELIQSKEHWQALNRLKGISGFVTTLSRDGDNRASVFNRLAHVERVLLVSRMLCHIGQIDATFSDRLVVVHDLNRWTFAHNSEYGMYRQEADIGNYLRNVAPKLAVEELDSLKSLHRKELTGMRPIVRPVLAADLLTGMVEDVILLLAGLNVHPEVISKKLCEMVFSDLPELGRRQLCGLCVILNVDKKPEHFSIAFHEFFVERVKHLIQLYAARSASFDAMLELIVRELLQIRKTETMQLFHINNELICHRSFIRSLITALAEQYGFHSLCKMLLTLDESEFVAHLRKEGMSVRDLDPLYPALDYTNQADSSVRCLIRLQ